MLSNTIPDSLPSWQNNATPTSSNNTKKQWWSTNKEIASKSSALGNSWQFKPSSTISMNSNYYSFPKHKPKSKKKTGNTCYCLNLLDKFGALNIYFTSSRINISKISLILFDDNFDELFEKGKRESHSILNPNSKVNRSSVSDLTFWFQRFYYYSKYEEGIQMDNESWWSVTPEIIAEYTAKLVKGATVIDGFCGSGGNVIQFSRFCKKVYAIDIDENKLNICKNNCNVYGCQGNISFIHSDFLTVDTYPNELVEADYIFLSPPWGGTKYKNSEVYSIKEWMTPNICDIVKMSLKIAKKIMFFVPRTWWLNEWFDIIYDITKEERLFFDVHVLKSANKIKALLIIFGEDVNVKINENEIKHYLNLFYEQYKMSEKNIKILCAIAKIIGCYRFFTNEHEFRTSRLKKVIIKEGDTEGNCCHCTSGTTNSNGSLGEGEHDMSNEVIKYFFNRILTEQEKIKLKSLNLFNPKQTKQQEQQQQVNSLNGSNKVYQVYPSETGGNITDMKEITANAINSIINVSIVNPKAGKNSNGSTETTKSGETVHTQLREEKRSPNSNHSQSKWVLTSINQMSFQFLS